MGYGTQPDLRIPWAKIARRLAVIALAFAAGLYYSLGDYDLWKCDPDWGKAERAEVRS